MRWAVAVLALGFAVTPGHAQTPPDRCPAPEERPRIEVLSEGSPFVDEQDTCGFKDDRQRYLGGTCGLQSAVYGDPDAVYQVRLNRSPDLDNRVGFRLETLSPGADLVLVLARETEPGASCTDQPCFTHSPDFIGSGTEEIPPQSYPSGTYYLFVDSATSEPEGHCGRYRLTAFGVNPTPDLRVELAARPAPVVAGTDLTYTLTVTNTGTLTATEVEAAIRLPPSTALRRAPDECQSRGGRELLCRLGDLPAEGGARPPLEIVVAVDPAARGVLRASAAAEAREGGQDVDQCPGGDRSLLHCAEEETDVDAVTDLVLVKEATPEPVVAGCPLVYRLAVTNHGPSEATQVLVTDLLPETLAAAPEVPEERCPEAPEVPEGCSLSVCGPEPGSPRRQSCLVGRLAPGERAEPCIVRTVAPSAGDPSDGTDVLRNRAEVAGASDERDPAPSTNTVLERTGVIRWTDLGVVKRALADTVGGATDDLPYAVIVSNRGPSDSTGATVTDPLPEDMSFLSSPHDCSEAGGTITCETGPLPANESRRVSFTMMLAPDSVREEVLNEASVSPSRPEVETEPQDGDFSGNDTSSVTTPVELVDLALTKSAVPGGEVVAGENLLYRLTVASKRRVGRSFASHGGRVLDTLDPDLSFVGSPDGCFPTEGEDGFTQVECPFGLLPVDEEVDLRFVARVDPSAVGGVLPNSAEIDSRHDPDSSNDTGAAETTIVRKAMLDTEMSDRPDPVLVDERLTYSFSVVNQGPSDTTDIQVCDFLPEGVAGPDLLPEGCSTGAEAESECPGSGDRGGAVVFCRLVEEGERLPPGDSTEPLELTVNAPQGRGVIENVARAISAETDPEMGFAEAAEDTTVAKSGDRDLEVTVTKSVDPVRVEDVLVYKIRVAHRGPGGDPAEDVAVQVVLPPGTSFVNASGVCAREVGVVTCDLAVLESGDFKDLEVRVTVQEPGTLVLKAEAGEAPSAGVPPVDPTALCPDATPSTQTDPDPNRRNNCITEETLAFFAPDLVLPYFDLGEESRTPTLLAVRNDSRDQIILRQELFSPRGSLELSERCGLMPRGVLTTNLHRIAGAREESCASDRHPVAPSTGFAGITQEDPEGPTSDERRHSLSGDQFRLDLLDQSASGSLLVDTDSRRVPQELCRRWAVRFLNGGAFDGETDFVFWTPPGSDDAEAAERTFRGRVYTEAGDFVQEVAIETADRAFQHPAGARFKEEEGNRRFLDTSLLANFGVMEWDLGEGVVGNVSAVHRAAGASGENGVAVGVPGACLDPRPVGHQPGGDAPLVLPYFEVGTDGVTTLLAVRNEADQGVEVAFRYFAPTEGAPVFEQTCTLSAREVRTVNLRNLTMRRDPRCDPPERPSGGNDLLTGYVEIQAVPDDPREEVFLSGDYFKISPASGLAAGDALIDTGVESGNSPVPPHICRRWATRLLHGGDLATKFVFYAPDGTGGIEGEVFDEDGSGKGIVATPSGEGVAFVVDSGFVLQEIDEDGDLFGSIEWAIPGDGGNVSTLFETEDRFSILVPGVCLDRLESGPEP